MSGSPGWLDRKSWRDWIDYERAADERMARHHIITLCTYSAQGWSTAEVAEVVNSHHYTLVRRDGQWQLLENPTIAQKMRELERSLQRLSLLHSLASMPAEFRELKPLLERALERILKLPVLEPRGAIFLMNEAGTALRLAAGHGLTPEFAPGESEIPVGECLCGL